jgi:NADPH:quinone reductase-like Zn-dependent oxidoreductase
VRAAVVTEPGARPICTEFPEPEPLPGQELLTLVGAGVHWVVRSIAAGRHYGSDHGYPLVPGVDAVARATDGRLVYTGWPQPPWGTIAERLATPIGLDLPPGADPLAIAAGTNPGMSGWLPLTARLDELGRLGTVLVLGATGMSGSMAVQSALTLGAERVIAAGRDPEALGRLEARGVHVVRLTTDDAVDSLAAAVADTPPSLVLDYVWGPVAEAAFAALGRHGLTQDTADIAYVQIGSLGGTNAALPAALLRSRRIRVTGSGAGSASTQRMLAELPKVMTLIADGTLTVPYTAYPLSHVRDAWDHQGPGRAVVTPPAAPTGPRPQTSPSGRCFPQQCVGSGRRRVGEHAQRRLRPGVADHLQVQPRHQVNRDGPLRRVDDPRHRVPESSGPDQGQVDGPVAAARRGQYRGCEGRLVRCVQDQTRERLPLPQLATRVRDGQCRAEHLGHEVPGIVPGDLGVRLDANAQQTRQFVPFAPSHSLQTLADHDQLVRRRERVPVPHVDHEVQRRGKVGEAIQLAVDRLPPNDTLP